MSENPVITISRQYGAGGRELAEILSKKLDIKLYDRQIVHIAAAKLGIDDLSEEDLLEMENQVKPLSMSFIPFSAHTRMSGVDTDSSRIRCKWAGSNSSATSMYPRQAWR